MRALRTLSIVFVLALIAACGSDTSTDSGGQAATNQPTAVPVPTTAPIVTDATPLPTSDDTSEPDATAEEVAASSATPVRVRAEVWADNWFALYANGVYVGEDSVPITTERSFNAETIEFETTLPLTIAFEAKDFKETDSGIEYIGLNNQQMGDGGIIAQFTNLDTGEVIAVTDGSWRALPIHRAPLNVECERDPDPDSTCVSEILEAPAGWTAVDFDDAGWVAASEWSEDAVRPKDGYDQIAWTESAALIWGSDLEIDNTVLLRTTVG